MCGSRTLCVMVIMAVGLAACVSSSIVWTAHHNFSNTRWKPEEMVAFTPDTVSLQKDSIYRPNTGVLSIRYIEGAAIENLPLVMEIESPQDGIYRCDTIVVRLLPKTDRTANKGKIGIFETEDTIPLHTNVVPGWTVYFYPAMEDDINGIISLTFDLIKN